MSTEEFRANGSPADFHSVTLDHANGGKSFNRTDGVTSFDFNDNVDRGEVRGRGRYMKGLTTGEYKADISLEWLSAAWTEIESQLSDLGNGVYGFKGDLTLSYTEQDGTYVVVVAQGVQYKTRKRSGKQGTDGLKVQTDLDIEGKIFVNGVGPFGEKL